MDRERFSERINAVFSANGLSLSENEADLFFLLTQKIIEANGKFNLTAVTDPAEMILLHYADCAAVARIFPEGGTVADIGAGGGFPTLPLSILRPDLKITAVDSTEKRMCFVRETARDLGLNGVSVAVGRAEDLGRGALRESFDAVTARAVARLNVLCELCLPLVRRGGIFCAMKGPEGSEECAEAANAISLLGATVERESRFVLTDPTDGRNAERMLIVLRKNDPCPEKYPRRYARMSSDPL